MTTSSTRGAEKRKAVEYDSISNSSSSGISRYDVPEGGTSDEEFIKFLLKRPNVDEIKAFIQQVDQNEELSDVHKLYVRIGMLAKMISYLNFRKEYYKKQSQNWRMTAMDKALRTEATEEVATMVLRSSYINADFALRIMQRAEQMEDLICKIMPEIDGNSHIHQGPVQALKALLCQTDELLPTV